MIRQRRLGQHFLSSNSVARLIASEARITKNDVVFELGTGLGVLTPLLCGMADRVISVDADRQLAEGARTELSGIENLVVRHEDGLKSTDSFSIFVSNLPYSRSRDAIEWLAQRQFSHGVIMVQREFAEKLLAVSPMRRAVSVVAMHAFDIRMISSVGRNNFRPPPKVDSVILGIAKRNTLDQEQIRTINRIFSYRRKTVKNVLRQFGLDSTECQRIDDLSGDEIVGIANRILGR